jgi:hypothetical protein
MDRGVEAGYGGELRGVFPWLLNSSCTPCSSFASCDVNRKKPRYRSHRLRGVRRWNPLFIFYLGSPASVSV